MLEKPKRKKMRKKETDLPKKEKVADTGAPEENHQSRALSGRRNLQQVQRRKESKKRTNFFQREGKWRNKWATLALKGTVGPWYVRLAPSRHVSEQSKTIPSLYDHYARNKRSKKITSMTLAFHIPKVVYLDNHGIGGQLIWIFYIFFPSTEGQPSSV